MPGSDVQRLYLPAGLHDLTALFDDGRTPLSQCAVIDDAIDACIDPSDGSPSDRQEIAATLAAHTAAHMPTHAGDLPRAVVVADLAEPSGPVADPNPGEHRYGRTWEARGPVTLNSVACIFIVRRESVNDLRALPDLLWYDPSEQADIFRALRD